MRYTSAERVAQGRRVGVALVFALVVFTVLFRGGDAGPGASPTPTATAISRPPDVTISQATCCTQTARALLAKWESSAHINAAKVTLTPDPGFDCNASIDANGLKGTFSCRGLLKGATGYVANLQLTTAVGTFPFEHRFKTMGDRLTDVKWFTEFEDPKGEPLSCAAASSRIIQNYTTGKAPLPAQALLDLCRQCNNSHDSGRA